MRSRSASVGLAVRMLGLLLLTTCTENVPTSTPSSHTAPSPAPPPVMQPVGPAGAAALLIGAGDIARCDRTNDEATGLLLDNYPTATVFTAGDNINGNGSLNDFNNCYGPSWGRNKSRTRPGVGDQEYKTAGAAGYHQYFGAAAGDSAKYYYSYDLGLWHIMVLNDNISMAAGSAQEQWLRAELAGNTKKCTLAYWHHPRFRSTGANLLASVKPLWDALYDWSADVVLNAHYDNYERFAPQTPAGAADPAKGMREFIVGMGGQNLQKPAGPKPNSQVRNGTTYGVLKLALDTASYSWQFVPVAGQTFSDTGTTACHTHVAVASVTVSPSSATVQVGGTVQLTATPNDAAGNPLTDRTVTWTSSDTTIARVNGSGLVTGKANGGPMNITATSQGKSDTSVVTVQPSSGPPVLAGAGDIADCSRLSQEGTAKVLDGIVGQVATFGDGAYPDGSLSDYMNCFDPSWGRHKARTRPSTGNHEYNHGTSAGAPGYFAYWGAAAGDSGVGYYSYELGAWHIVVINSNVDMSAGSPQEQWLRADLAAHPTTCTLAYWHHPRFSSGGNGSTVATQPIWQALYDNYADVVINGHDHDYERFAPQTPDGTLDTVRGIREFVVGTGGNSLYSWPGNPIANSEVRSDVSYGVIK